MLRNIAVIEDSETQTKCLKSYFARFEKENRDIFSITCFTTADVFIAQYQPVYDIIFMDIMLPGTNGMDAAMTLRRMDERVTLIFVTNMAQFAVKGYEVQAFDFIVKPVAWPDFSMKLQRALNRLSAIPGSELITLNLPDSIKTIPVLQIRYVEVCGHRLIYHTGSGNFTVYGTMKSAEAELDSRSFFRCNHCYLVNLNYVESIGANSTVVDGEELQVSRARRRAFVQQLNDFLGGTL